jgi:hypothetical protein
MPEEDDDLYTNETLRISDEDRALLQGLSAIARREEEQRLAEIEPEDSQRATDIGLPPEAFVT